jgi:hypothetical protein
MPRQKNQLDRSCGLFRRWPFKRLANGRQILPELVELPMLLARSARQAMGEFVDVGV